MNVPSLKLIGLIKLLRMKTQNENTCYPMGKKLEKEKEILTKTRAVSQKLGTANYTQLYNITCQLWNR